MLFYIIVFCIIGVVIGVKSENFKTALAIIVVISLCWAVVFGPWAVAAFIELLLGCGVARFFKREHANGSPRKKEFEDLSPVTGKTADEQLLEILNKTPEPKDADEYLKALDAGIRKSKGGITVDKPVALKTKVQAGLQADSHNPYTNSIGMKFVLIPAGGFLRDAGSDENPIPNGLKVAISQPFYLGIYPVTQEQWDAVMGRNPSWPKGRGNWARTQISDLATADEAWKLWKAEMGFANPSWFLGQSNPVDSVSWEDAQEFINRLNAKEKHKRYRLPTNMEWELAARAGTNSKFFLGDDPELLNDYAWTGENCDDRTHPVGQKLPNPYGLYDIYGNVSEWAQDWYGELPEGKVKDYRGPSSGEYRKYQGGRSLSVNEAVWINDLDPMFWNYLQGFRVALSLENVSESFRAQELGLDAEWVQKNLPEALRAPGFYLNAIRSHGRMLASVPEVLRTPELCLAAVQADRAANWGTVALEYVPKDMKTPELCLVAVQADGLVLKHVPKALKTAKLCMAAVESNGWALRYVPEGLVTPQLCYAAAESNGSALKFVPEALLTPEICLAAVQSKGSALEYVPEALKTQILCLAAVLDDDRALEFVPQELREKVGSFEQITRENGDFTPADDYKVVPRENSLNALTEDEFLEYLYTKSVLEGIDLMESEGDNTMQETEAQRTLIAVGDIQALHHYHPYWIYGETKKKNPDFDNNSRLILELKKSSEHAVLHFADELKSVIPKKVVVCIVPSSKVGFGDNKSIGLVAKALCKNDRVDGTQCLYRHTEIEKLSGGGSRQRIVHDKSIKVDNVSKFNNKVVWLLDDVVTTGNSMNVCAKKLIDNGASEVHCIAVAATFRSNENDDIPF